jgi:hypothetical protein
MSRVHILRKISLRNCPYCLSSQVYFSRPKRWWEKLPFIFLLQLVRCHNCMRRHYRPIMFATPKHPATETVERKAPQIIPAEERQDRLA